MRSVTEAVKLLENIEREAVLQKTEAIRYHNDGLAHAWDEVKADARDCAVSLRRVIPASEKNLRRRVVVRRVPEAIQMLRARMP